MAQEKRIEFFKFILYLSIQERDFEGLLQSSQLGFLHELDGREKSLGSIMHTKSQVGKLLFQNKYLTIISKLTSHWLNIPWQ